MPVFAAGTCDYHRALVVALLGYGVGGPVETRFAGECDLV